MENTVNKLNESSIRAYLPADCTVSVACVVCSTNDEAKKLCVSGAKQGSVCVANEQTNGRGRRGRSFFSPADSGVYFSMLLRPIDASEKLVLITTAAAVAVSEVIDELTGLDSRIKWLNDVYLNGKKCVGIMCEGVFNGDGSVEGIIVGVGINVTTVDFPDEIMNKAGSIGTVDRNELVGKCVQKILQYCTRFDASHMDKYRRKNFVLGRKVTVNTFNDTYDAIALKITDDGKLVVAKDGKEKALYSEEVSVKINDD